MKQSICKSEFENMTEEERDLAKFRLIIKINQHLAKLEGGSPSNNKENKKDDTA